MLLGPRHLLKVQAVLWLIGVVVFAALNATFSGSLARNVALTVALGGTTTCSVAYLLSERALRPITMRALADGLPERESLPGVGARAMLAWGLGTGVPVVGLALVAAFVLAGASTTVDQLSVTILALSATALLIGGLVTILAARQTADPVHSVADALAEVQAGRFDVRVPVYDGTEIGLLQSGFNRMSAGLAERERIRELFGRQVGADVARAALEGGIELGGEERDVAVLFVDLIGSTALAADRPPQEVVAVINRFFAVVVQAVDGEGGWINKFEGDGALAIFGAPIALPDAYGHALAAARAAAGELVRQLPEYPAAVGVSAGLAVAGHIGETQRYEYTVIGDPVNEAARLTELAKTAPGRRARQRGGRARGGRRGGRGLGARRGRDAAGTQPPDAPGPPGRGPPARAGSRSGSARVTRRVTSMSRPGGPTPDHPDGCEPRHLQGLRRPRSLRPGHRRRRRRAGRARVRARPLVAGGQGAARAANRPRPRHAAHRAGARGSLPPGHDLGERPRHRRRAGRLARCSITSSARASSTAA